MNSFIMKIIENIEEVLYTEEQINTRIEELANEISKDYKNKEVIIIGLFKGSFLMVSDLVKKLTVETKIDFLSASSYGNSTISSGEIQINKDINIDIEGKHIIIVEDLIDTGQTLYWIKNHFQHKRPESIKICCLLNKKVERNNENDINIDYVGFDCPNKFVVGYGMDYAEHYRTLPFIGVLKPSVYE